MPDTHELMTEKILRIDLAAVHRIFAIENLNEGTWTHCSCKLGFKDRYLVTPGSTHFSMVSASSLLLYNAEGTLISGDGEANHDAVPIHMPIYNVRPDVECVLHFHSPYATTLSVIKNGRLNTLLSQTAAYFHHKISYLDTYSVPRTSAAEGEQMANALGQKKVLFMKNHGVLIAAKSLDDAVVSAYQLERACQIQILAASTGEELEEMEEKYAELLAAEHCSGEPNYFAGMKRLLDSQQSNFKK